MNDPMESAASTYTEGMPQMRHPPCKNARYHHLNHYGDKHRGYCLECTNAGVDELQDRIDALESERNAKVAQWNDYWQREKAELEAALATEKKQAAALREALATKVFSDNGYCSWCHRHIQDQHADDCAAKLLSSDVGRDHIHRSFMEKP